MGNQETGAENTFISTWRMNECVPLMYATILLRMFLCFDLVDAICIETVNEGAVRGPGGSLGRRGV